MADPSQREADTRSTVAPMDEPTVRGDVAVGVVCVLTAAVGAFLVVPGWVYVPQRVAGTIDSPAVMPLLMLALLGLFGAILLADKSRKFAADRQRRQPAEWRRAAGMMAVCALYLGLILMIGLPLASFVSLIAAMVYFGERRWLIILPVAIFAPLLLWAFFAYVALVPMPQPLLRFGALCAGPAIAAVEAAPMFGGVA